MTSETQKTTQEDLVAKFLAFIADHRATYLSSGGTEGHIMDMSHVGVPHPVPTLLLKTVGRKSGKTLITPLIYGPYSDSFVVVASKGGAPEHPAWYLNLTEKPEVEFQIGTQAFRGRWRLAEGPERSAVWAYMNTIYPPYNDYQKATAGRVIPLVMMKAETPIPVFKADA